MKRSEGVTLIELMVVLAVSLILFGVVSVSFTSLNRKRVDAACYRLQASLRYAQRLAVTEGREYRVVFDTVSKDKYSIRHVGENAVTLVTVSEELLPEGITFHIDLASPSDSAVTYGPKGTPDKGKTITVIGDGCLRRLTILPSGGRVELKEMEILK